MCNFEYCDNEACPACFLRKSLLLARTQYDSEEGFTLAVLAALGSVMVDGELTIHELDLEDNFTDGVTRH
jgi:hypothetical protein